MEIIGFLLILLLVTRVFGEIAVRLGQPSMVGELISGILLGVVFAQFWGADSGLSSVAKSDAFVAITDLAAFFIMLQAGIEMKPSEIAKASGRALVVGLSGFIVPLALGFCLGWLMIPDSAGKVAQSLFLGTALAVTAVAVSVKMLMDMGALHTRFGEIIVSAAIFDDILGLVLLAFLTAFISTGALPTVAGLALLLGKVVLFFGIATAVGLYVFPRFARLIKWLREPEMELGVLLIVALAYAVLADALGMHFIVGAFMAGLFFRRGAVDAKTYKAVKSKVAGFTSGFLAPLFFAAIGFRADLGAAAEVPLFVALLVALAFAGKLAGAGLAARFSGLTTGEAACVGVGMSSRGAVELVIADIALKAGLFAIPSPAPPIVANMFSAVVFMAVITTLAAPIALRFLLRCHGPTEG